MSSTDHIGFLQPRSAIQGMIYVPRFYNVEITDRLNELSTTHELIKVDDLMQAGHLIASTGHEIGKMAYGTGSIPFVRTSDISTWEIKTDPNTTASDTIE